MTRRPIFIGVATVLALALTAGLAYGAGRMVSTQGYTDQTGRQGPQRVVAVVPGSSWGTSVNGQSLAGTAYRDQMREWMRDRFQSWLNHAAFAGNRWANRGTFHASTGTVNGGASYQGSGSSYSGNGYQNHSGYPHDDHMGSWGGGRDGECCGW
jgi:hypothetical protein